MTPSTSRRIGKAAAMIALLSAFVLGAAGAALARSQETVTGVIKPSEISRGVVKQCYLKTEDGAKLLVLNNQKGKELLERTKSTVRATGYIRKPKSDKGFEKIIDVVEYEVLDPPADKGTQAKADPPAESDPE